MDTLYTFGDNITHYKTESVHFLGLMNSATKLLWLSLQVALTSMPTIPAQAQNRDQWAEEKAGHVSFLPIVSVGWNYSFLGFKALVFRILLCNPEKQLQRRL